MVGLLLKVKDIIKLMFCNCCVFVKSLARISLCHSQHYALIRLFSPNVYLFYIVIVTMWPLKYAYNVRIGLQ